MKQQDEELTRHIKALFEDVDDGLSENGWAELRKKYPEAPSKKLPIWWLSGIAASILVVAGLFLFTQKNTPKTEHNDPLVQTPKTEKPDYKTDNTLSPNSPVQTEGASTVAKPKPGQQKRTSPNQDLRFAHQMAKNPKENPSIVPVNAALAQKDSISKNVTSPQQVIANQPAQNPVANQSVIAAVTDQPAKQPKDNTPPKKTTEEFLQEQSKVLMASSNHKKEEKQQELSNSFDVYTGTFVNYYANNAAKINAGFGVNANIKVSPNISVSVGAGLSQNRLSYDNSNSVPRSLASDVSSQAMAYNVMSSESRISDIKVNAQLLSIDIPITVKFYPGKKKNFYLATGINSNSYLLQRYTYDYTVQNSAAFVKSVPIEKQTEESKFKGFDFANSAIIAIGLSQSIGRNTIIFEPYFKPTIGSMGEKNLKINTAGLNLRFNFTGKKK
ncbi:hypothetical protein VRU48_00425 [Pedobacter sp. KR3-3]|uniref:Outer membrane protein beta-barrel domain-containing protein n=1 Tax=Pedobacter albus TaxID=3113905 RepID=A0ABU7I259_9SPHI|nr:hypothetical protein [Pedobacter sp. KR3-3]MEE1943550.1 hypothetical protein [Pedobacter sp. KR3-3]